MMSMCKADLTPDAVTKHPDLGGETAASLPQSHQSCVGPFSARSFPELPIQLLLIHLVPHMLDVELLLSLPEVVELLLAASRRSNVSF
jgi:hypothetical protein